MQTIILHLDMNSYFASCEQQANLAWRHRPVGVCEHLGGIIIAASIEAKKWGIKTGTPVWEARKLYPKIILTKTSPELYRRITRRLVKVVSDYTNRVDIYSIDEVFLDITRVCNVSAEGSPLEEDSPLQKVDPFKEAVKIAQEIKQRMKNEVGDYLTCSIGIAENKVLAKIASDMQKPDGLTVIFADFNSEHSDFNSLYSDREQKILILNKQELYGKLQLTDVPGIGERMKNRLADLGIKTLAQLRDFPESRLVALWGVPGKHLHDLGKLSSGEAAFSARSAALAMPGAENLEQKNSRDIKSMGHMYTLPVRFREQKFFVPVLYKLSEMVGRRLRKQNLMGNVMYFHFHSRDHKHYGKSKRLGYYIFDGREIFLEAMNICADLFRGHSRGLNGFKLIGVVISGLTPYVKQLSLFGDAENYRRMVEALDKINEKYGDFTICRAPVILAGKVFRDSIGFGRIKEL